MQIYKFFKYSLAAVFSLCLLSGSAVLAQTVNPASSSAESDFQYAEKLARDNFVDLAVAQYEEFLRRYPNDARVPEALHRMAAGYFSLRRYDKARETNERLLLRYAGSPFAEDALFNIGRSYEAQGEFAAAAQQYERFALMSDNPQLAARAQIAAGRLYLQTGNREKGRRILLSVMEKYTENENAQAEANLLLLQDFMAAGEHQRAYRAAEQFLRRFSEITATPAVRFIKAELHEIFGQHGKALETYELIASQYPNRPASFRANLAAARLTFRMGDHKRAIELAGRAATSQNDSLRAAAILAQGSFYFAGAQYGDALKVLSAMPETGPYAADRALLAGRTHFARGEFEQSLVSLARAREVVTAKDDSLAQVIAFERARAAFELGSGAQAIDFIREAEGIAAAAHLQPEILLLQADIYYTLYQDRARAARLYSIFMERFPGHVKVDATQAKIARCYEMLQDWKLARTEWQRLLQNYPASPHVETANEHIRLIDDYFTPDYARLVDNLLVRYGDNGATLRSELTRAELHFGLKQYDQALTVLKDVLARQPAPDARQRALYLLGFSYFALGEMERLRPSGLNPAWYDSAQVVLRLIGERYADAELRPQVELLLGKILLARSPQASAVVLDSLSARHADNPAFAAIHRHALQQPLPASALDSGFRAAYAARLDRVAALPGAGLATLAELRKARLALAAADTATAIRHLHRISESQIADPARAQAELLYARLLLATRQPEVAEHLLGTIHTKYFYSSIADSALLLLGRQALRSGKPEKSIQWFRQLRARRLDWLSSQDGGRLPEAIYYEAEAHRQSGNLLTATTTFLEFLRQNPEHPLAIQAYFALAEVAQSMGAFKLAEGYYNDLLARMPRNETGAEAKYRLAELEFKRENYKAARTLALEALQLQPQFQFRMEAAKLAIVAALRQNNANAVADDIRNFEREFKDANRARAEIQYELGDHYIRQKDFRQADRIFRDLRKKYEDTEYAIQGDFGYGKSLLFQTKTEEALNVLMEIPSRYPNDPFLRTVWVNLGDFYMQQQQWPNAISAFQKVLADSIYDTEHKAALIKLISVYAGVQMYDLALMRARELLDLFPEEDQSLSISLQIGTFLRATSRYSEAIDHYRALRPYASGETAAEIQFFIGECYFDAGKYELALGEYMQLRYSTVQTKLPWRATAIHKAGECYLRLQELEKAREQYEFLLRLEGGASRFGDYARQKISQIDQMLAKSASNSRS